MPLEHRKAERLDLRAGLEFSLWRALPHGYTLALEASGQFGWSNLPDTFPIGSSRTNRAMELIRQMRQQGELR